MNNRIITISGLAGSGKSTIIQTLYDAWSNAGKAVASVAGNSTEAGVRQFLRTGTFYAVLIDGEMSRSLLDALPRIADDYPHTLFIVTQLCGERRLQVKRVFCWLPTEVYSGRYMRDGFRWFRFVWVGADGKHYVSEKAAGVKVQS